jgi:hypothetical protein
MNKNRSRDLHQKVNEGDAFCKKRFGRRHLRRLDFEWEELRKRENQLTESISIIEKDEIKSQSIKNLFLSAN